MKGERKGREGKEGWDGMGGQSGKRKNGDKVCPRSSCLFAAAASRIWACAQLLPDCCGWVVLRVVVTLCWGRCTGGWHTFWGVAFGPIHLSSCAFGGSCIGKN